MSEKTKEIKELIDKIRGTTPSKELLKKVEVVIEADEKMAKEKVKTDKKKLDDIKAAEKKLRDDAAKEVFEAKAALAREKAKAEKKKKAGNEEEEKSEEDSEEEDDSEAVIKKLTEEMAKMTEEINALKKRKNYRTKPPKAEKVEEVDDFIKQNITKDFEMVV